MMRIFSQGKHPSNCSLTQLMAVNNGSVVLLYTEKGSVRLIFSCESTPLYQKRNYSVNKAWVLLENLVNLSIECAQFISGWSVPVSNRRDNL